MPDFAQIVDWPSLHGDAFAGRTCLVTGGAGFIGSHVADALTALGAKVRVADNLSGGQRENLPEAAELIDCDITDAHAVSSAIDGCEFVFHLAALVSVPASVEQPRAYHEVDAGGTVNVLEAARQNGCRRVIYSASSSAYGDSPTLPKHEEMVPKPMSPYAAAKLAGEQYVRSHAAVYDLDAVSLRYFNIYGPRQNANSAYAGVVAAFARDLLAGRRPTIFGDGSASRDFTYVANAVHANLLAARHEGALGGEVYNVGIGRRITVLELAQQMAQAARRPDLQPQFAEPRAGDVPHSLADLTRSRERLGYEPVVEFADGLARTVDWYRSQA